MECLKTIKCVQLHSWVVCRQSSICLGYKFNVRKHLCNLNIYIDEWKEVFAFILFHFKHCYLTAASINTPTLARTCIDHA
jgi:hypothetical protein